MCFYVRYCITRHKGDNAKNRFINHRLKDLQTLHATQTDYAKLLCVGDVPKSQIKKNFPIDAQHPLNKWCKDLVKERTQMLINHDFWGVMGADIMSLTTIIHLPTVVTNSKGNTLITGHLGLSLGTKLEVEISQDFLLDTVATTNPLQLDTLHSVLPLQTSAGTKKPANK